MSNLNVAGKVFSLSRIKYWLLYCTRLINRSDIFSPLRIYTYYSSYCLAPLRLSSHKLVLMFHMHRYGLCVFLIYAFYVLLSLELFVLSNDVIFAFYFLVSCRLNLNAQNTISTLQRMAMSTINLAVRLAMFVLIPFARPHSLGVLKAPCCCAFLILFSA